MQDKVFSRNISILNLKKFRPEVTYTHLSNHHQAERTKYGVQQITNTLTARNKNKDKCREEIVSDN